MLPGSSYIATDTKKSLYVLTSTVYIKLGSTSYFALRTTEVAMSHNARLQIRREQQATIIDHC
jgi:hypothetical protein